MSKLFYFKGKVYREFGLLHEGRKVTTKSSLDMPLERTILRLKDTFGFHFTSVVTCDSREDLMTQLQEAIDAL